MKKTSLLLAICSIFVMSSMGVAEAKGHHGAGHASKKSVHKSSSKAVKSSGSSKSSVKFI